MNKADPISALMQLILQLKTVNTETAMSQQWGRACWRKHAGTHTPWRVEMAKGIFKRANKIRGEEREDG